MNKGRGWLRAVWPFLVIGLLISIFYYPVWLKGKVLFPADIIVGTYYPWLDYKWLGYNAGVPVKNPLISDVPSVIYPQRLLAIEQIKQGIWPLWNPLMFSGYPLLATFQSAVLNPLNLLYFVMPFVDAWSLQVMSQTFLAGIWTFLFLRSIKCCRLAALFGGVAFGLSGFMVFWLEFNVLGHVASMIPLLLFLVTKFLDSKRLIYLLALAVVVAIQIFDGYPQLSLYSIGLVGLWSFAKLRSSQLSGKKRTKYLLVIGFFVLLGLGLASIQLWPGLELYRMSQRVVEVLPEGLRFLSSQLLITMIVPFYFGNVTAYNYWGVGNFANTVGFSGMVVFIFACLALRTFKRRFETKFFVILLVASLLFISNNFISQALIVNFLEKFIHGLGASSMTRLLVITGFCLAVLGSIGLDELMSGRSFRTIYRWLYLPAIIVVAVGLGTLASFMYLKLNLEVVGLTRIQVDNLAAVFNQYSIALRNLSIPVAILISCLILIGLAIWQIKWRSYIYLLIVLVMIFEVFNYGWKETTFSERGFVYPTTPVIEFLQNQEQPFRIATGEVIPSNMWMPYSLSALDGYDAVYPAVQAKMLALINNHNPKTIPMSRYGRVYDYNNRLIDLTNTKYLLAIKKNASDVLGPLEKTHNVYNPNKFKQIFSAGSVEVLENKAVLPRAFIVTNWETLASDQALFDKLVDDKYPFDQKIMLGEQFDLFKQSGSNTWQVKFSKYQPDKLEMDVTSARDGWLFVADTYYPGWKAMVDGQSQQIYQANYAFRAVPMRAGRHQIKMYYQPDSFRWGVGLSIVSLGFWLGILIFRTRLAQKYAIS